MLKDGTKSHSFFRVSAENCARIYNRTLSSKSSHILNNPLAHRSSKEMPTHASAPVSMTPEHVSEGFMLYSLLLHHAEQSKVLILPHDVGSQRLRLRDAMDARNKEMEGTGQELWNHACDKCCVVLENGEGTRISDLLS